MCWNFLSLRAERGASAAEVPACCSAHSSSAPERKGEKAGQAVVPQWVGRGKKHTLSCSLPSLSAAGLTVYRPEPQDPVFFSKLLVLGSSLEDKTDEGERGNRAEEEKVLEREERNKSRRKANSLLFLAGHPTLRYTVGLPWTAWSSRCPCSLYSQDQPPGKAPCNLG